MRLADFDYTLPQELIAQEPLEPRDAARLLVLDRAIARIQHHQVRELPDLLRAGDLLVANRSRVLPARVRGRLRGGGTAEFLLLRRLSPGKWQALARPARRLRPGDIVEVTPTLRVHVASVFPAGLREIEVHAADDAQDVDAALLASGAVPLPPYIHGWRGDPERYQTIFADTDGSAAAPTAGLHFTSHLLRRLTHARVRGGTLVLHVGLSTFRPITRPDTAAHHMYREWCSLTADRRA